MTELIEVLIPRDEWVRGGREGEFGYAGLLNDKGNKCCLGHMGTACGVSDERLWMRGQPNSGISEYPRELFGKLDAWLVGPKLQVRHALAAINDAESVPDDIREEWIAEGFRRVGCKAVFVDTRGEATE